MAYTTRKIRFDKAGYYFIALIVFVLLGFWPSYFSKLVNGTSKYSFYFHIHAVTMALWVLILIVQPILIRKKKLHIHRVIGKLSYIVMPLLLASIILVLNNGMKGTPEKELNFMNIIFPCRDIVVLSTAFIIGTWYRRDINIHARAMVVTGIIFIEPSLGRFFVNVLFPGMVGGLITMIFMCALIIALIIIERKQKSARWIFPSLLGVYVFVYTLVLMQVQIPILDTCVRWFARLPLT